jgi:SAM-dependent methyltransferase
MKKSHVFHDKSELIKALVKPEHVVLDVGFLGQGIRYDDPLWPHRLIQESAKEVYGLDLKIDRSFFPDTTHYIEASAEDFTFPHTTFDLVFAGDLIEHLPNPGLFLSSVKRHLREGGQLVLTTPNAFNLFNLTEKLSKEEPTVNADHTCYFNIKTLNVLLAKCGFSIEEVGYVYTLGYKHQESMKKKFLNILYKILLPFTKKYLETLVIIAVPTSAIRDVVST